MEKTLVLGQTEGKRRRGVTEDETVGWHHRLGGRRLIKLWKLAREREAWRAAVRGVTKSWTRLSD